MRRIPFVESAPDKAIVTSGALPLRSEQRPLALWAESAERRQYYGEKQVGFGSNHPKSGFIIEQKWYDR